MERAAPGRWLRVDRQRRAVRQRQYQPVRFQLAATGTDGGLAPGDVPINGMFFPALVQGMHRAAGPVNAAFVATGVVASLPLAVPAAMSMGSAAANPMWIAVGRGSGAFGIHVAYRVGGTWLHGALDAFGEIEITGERAAAGCEDIPGLGFPRRCSTRRQRKRAALLQETASRLFGTP